MRVVAVRSDDPDPEVVREAVECLLRGEVIAGPSDTVYGFLARPGDARAMETLAALKERAGPFIALVATWEAARRVAGAVPETVWRRIGLVWPGPVTVVLPGASGGTIAVRMPKMRLLVDILSMLGESLVSTSANRAGEPPPARAAEVLGAFAQDAVPLLLDGGASVSREPSTLVDLTGIRARVLRSGRGDARPLLDPPPKTA